MKRSVINKSVERIRGIVRQALSPTFLIIVMCAAVLWYISKLGGEYTTEMEMTIRIDGQKYRPTVIITGRGSAILAQQLSLKSRLAFTLEELSPRPSRETLGALTITPASLAKAINGKITDLTIMQVTNAPEFTPPSDEEDEEAKSDDDKKEKKAEARKGDKNGNGRGNGGETPREKRKRERLERRQAKEAARAAEEAADEKADKAAAAEKSAKSKKALEAKIDKKLRSK
jgi:hypothetical protein